MIGCSFRAIERTNFFDSVYSPIIKMVTACTIAVMMVLAAENVTGNYFHLSAGKAVSMIAYILHYFHRWKLWGWKSSPYRPRQQHWNG